MLCLHVGFCERVLYLLGEQVVSYFFSIPKVQLNSIHIKTCRPYLLVSHLIYSIQLSVSLTTSCQSVSLSLSIVFFYQDKKLCKA